MTKSPTQGEAADQSSEAECDVNEVALSGVAQAIVLEASPYLDPEEKMRLAMLGRIRTEVSESTSENAMALLARVRESNGS